MQISPLVLSILFMLNGCTSPIPESSSVTNEPPITSTQNQEATASSTVEGKVELIKTYEGFSSPTAVVVDQEGNVYVSNWGGSTVTKIDKEGEQTDFAGDMGSPAGLAFDKSENLYISDYSKNVIYRVTPAGEKTTFAEGLHTPTGISFDKNGNLLVSNRSSDEIVKIDVQGNILAITNTMSTPVGVIEDTDGNLFVTNYGGSIKKVLSNGTATDFSTDFGRPGVGIDIGEQGQIFAADNGDGCVRQLFSDGTTTIVVDNIGGCVGVKVYNDILYVTSWNDGAVYAYSIK